MKLLFEEITGKAHLYTICGGSWFPPDNEDFLLTATANISVSRRSSDTVLLEGDLRGRRLAVCDRCGEQVEGDLSAEFEYLITTEKEHALELHEVECTDEDAITLYLKEPEIDVDEILREQAYLAVPLRTLCREDCKGICAGCGAALNSEACSCPMDKSSSTFALLKKLIKS